MDNGFPNKDWPDMMMTREPEIQTFSVKTLNYLDPDPDQINIRDIAQGLANTNRFSGQVVFPYSVAQHSYLASYAVPAEFRLEALLHDAQEAYMCDIPSPLKQLLPDYRRIEHRIERVIRAKYGLPLDMSPEVKKVDTLMLVTEARQFGLRWWAGIGPAPSEDIPIVEWTWREARDLFLQRFHQLTGCKWA